MENMEQLHRLVQLNGMSLISEQLKDSNFWVPQKEFRIVGRSN